MSQLNVWDNPAELNLTLLWSFSCLARKNLTNGKLDFLANDSPEKPELRFAGMVAKDNQTGQLYYGFESADIYYETQAAKNQGELIQNPFVNVNSTSQLLSITQANIQEFEKQVMLFPNYQTTQSGRVKTPVDIFSRQRTLLMNIVYKELSQTSLSQSSGEANSVEAYLARQDVLQQAANSKASQLDLDLL